MEKMHIERSGEKRPLRSEKFPRNKGWAGRTPARPLFLGGVQDEEGFCASIRRRRPDREAGCSGGVQDEGDFFGDGKGYARVLTTERTP